jgi:hypothetical protein
VGHGVQTAAAPGTVEVASCVWLCSDSLCIHVVHLESTYVARNRFTNRVIVNMLISRLWASTPCLPAINSCCLALD